jgi:hypothetical protein
MYAYGMIFQNQNQNQNQVQYTKQMLHANQTNHTPKSSGSVMLDRANDGVH